MKKDTRKSFFFMEHYDYSKLKSLEETVKEVKERAGYQDRFVKYLLKPFVRGLYLGLSRSVYNQIGVLGIENLEEIKKSKHIVLTYNHMIDYDVVEIVYHLLTEDIHPANVAFQDLFYKGSKLLRWFVEGAGAFPVFNDNRRFDITKLNNFFNYFWAYLSINRPVTIAVNGAIIRERRFPKPENGLAHILLNAPDKIKIEPSEIKIMPVGVAVTGNMNEYNKIFFDEKHYRNLVVRAVVAFSMLYKKSSLYIGFGKPFTLESVLENISSESLTLKNEPRNFLSEKIMDNVKKEITILWDHFDLEHKCNMSIDDYLRDDMPRNS